MPKESFLLVSLKEDKARKLAKVLHNESCRKILDYLTAKEATETELAKKLSVPISTVHYNLKHLLEAGLITAEEFHYSAKGREVNHYKLANKYIIIAPKSTFGLKERLRSVLPVALLVGASAFVIQIVRMGTATFGASKARVMEEAMATTAAAPAASAAQTSPIWWFLAGALLTIAIFLILDWIKSRQ